MTGKKSGKSRKVHEKSSINYLASQAIVHLLQYLSQVLFFCRKMANHIPYSFVGYSFEQILKCNVHLSTFSVFISKTIGMIYTQRSLVTSQFYKL